MKIQGTILTILGYLVFCVPGLFGQQTYNGILQHSNGYFTMNPYSATYDDGSYAKLFYDGNSRKIRLWNSSSTTDYTGIEVGNVHGHGYVLSVNPSNAGATIALSWLSNIPRLRIGGSGAGASNGLDIQGPGDASLLRVEGNGNIKSKGSIRSKGSVTTSNPDNSGASISMSWLNNVARIRIGGSGPGSSSGLDIQTTGDRSILRIEHSGKVGIGTTTPDEKLTVKGKVHAEEVKVDLSVPGPDYVFKEDYDLKSLEEVQNYIKTHGHLPNIPSAQEMAEEGIELGEMNMKLLEKIEELTLYIIEQEKRISKLESKNK